MVRPEDRAGEAADDRDLRTQVRAGRGEPSPGGVHAGHGVLHGHELVDAVPDVPFGPAQGRQDERAPARHHVRTVQLGRDLDGERAGSQRPRGDLGVRSGGGEVPAQSDEDPDPTFAHRADRLHRVQTRRPGHGQPELALQGVQKRGGRFLPDTHRPVALDVRVAANRAETRTRTTDHAPQEHEVDQFADGGHRLAVLGQAHRPARDGPARGRQELGDAFDLLAGKSGGGEDGRPVQVPDVRRVLLVPLGVVGDEVPVDHRPGFGPLPLHQQVPHRAEQREIPTDPDLAELVGQPDPPPQHAPEVLGVPEAEETRLRQRVDRDDPGAPGLRPFQGRQHPRVVRAGVLPDDQDQVGLVDVVQAHRALADADGLGQGRARGLVAHVGAVGQVVGAQAADEELVQERGLVAGPARGVEDGGVRVGLGGEFLGDHREGLVPPDGFVVVGALPEHHRFGEPSLLAQPVVRAGGQVRHRVPGEELPGDPAAGGLLGDGLGPVLAELGGVPAVSGLGPGAAGAVEAVPLVDQAQRVEGAAWPHLFQAASHRGEHAGYAGGPLLRGAHLGGGLVDVLVRSPVGHLPIVGHQVVGDQGLGDTECPAGGSGMPLSRSGIARSPAPPPPSRGRPRRGPLSWRTPGVPRRSDRRPVAREAVRRCRWPRDPSSSAPSPLPSSGEAAVAESLPRERMVPVPPGRGERGRCRPPSPGTRSNPARSSAAVSAGRPAPVRLR